MPNNEGMRRQPLPEEEGGAKLFFSVEICRGVIVTLPKRRATKTE